MPYDGNQKILAHQGDCLSEKPHRVVVKYQQINTNEWRLDFEEGFLVNAAGNGLSPRLIGVKEESKPGLKANVKRLETVVEAPLQSKDLIGNCSTCHGRERIPELRA